MNLKLGYSKTMGRDLRYQIITESLKSTNPEDYDECRDYYCLDSSPVGRHNNCIVPGVYSFTDLIKIITTLLQTLSDPVNLTAQPGTSANGFNVYDWTEAISVYTRFLREMGPDCHVVIKYD
jgi:hypothetical protein